MSDIYSGKVHRLTFKRLRHPTL